MRSFYHDMRTDTIITEHEYNKRMNVCLEASLVYFGEYNSRKEAQEKLDNDYAYLKNNPYWHPQMKTWKVWGIDLPIVRIKADCFDDAIKEARKINPDYCIGQIEE